MVERPFGHATAIYREPTALRTARSFRLLFTAAIGVLAAACESSDSPLEPPATPEVVDAAPIPRETAALAGARWADGHATASNPTVASYLPPPVESYNRSGGTITIVRPAGTTGRYVVTFTGLSALLGAKSMVHVSPIGDDLAYCLPCFAGNGARVDVAFTVLLGS